MRHFPLTGQSVSSIITKGDSVLVATSRGLNVTVDNGLNWNTVNMKIPGGIIAMFKDSRDGLWLSFGIDSLVPTGENEIAGKGIAYLPNNSSDWIYYEQPVDDKDDYNREVIEEPTTTNVSNVTYAITESYVGNYRKVWIASFAGSLRYINPDSLELGWRVKTPDGKKLWVGNQNPDEISSLSQRVFSLASNGNQLWVGSAYGVYYSTDSGDSFVNLSNANTGLSGDFVTLLGFNNGVLYANSRVTGSGQFNALNRYDFTNYTTVQNVEWKKDYRKDWVYSLSFSDDFILVGTEKNGLFIENAMINEPYHIDTFIDSFTGENIYGSGIFSSVLKLENNSFSLWIGTSEGVAKSDDHGNSWNLYKSKELFTSVINESVVAYPSPYSPMHSNRNIRFSFPINGSSKLTIYNFAMEEVYESSYINFIGNDLGTFTWNGKNKYGSIISNGVYFFRIKTGSKAYWNKFMVVN